MLATAWVALRHWHGSQNAGQVVLVCSIMTAVMLDCMQVIQLLRSSMPPLSGKAVQVQGASHGGTNSYFRAVTGNQEQTLSSPRCYMLKALCCGFLYALLLPTLGIFWCQGPGNALDIKPKLDVVLRVKQCLSIG